MTPDMISEVPRNDLDYSPEYGDSTGGQIIVTTRIAGPTSSTARRLSTFVTSH